MNLCEVPVNAPSVDPAETYPVEGEDDYFTAVADHVHSIACDSGAVQADCVGEALAAVAGVVVAAVEIYKFGNWTVDNMFRMTGRALLAKSAWLGVAGGLTAYGAYSYYVCRVD
ncbi:MAG TPA: hypothetical protein VMN60_12550 [Longimicrobiales bacterium]|nr:hypothetical protein [Longimicrobiales bacterium]